MKVSSFLPAVTHMIYDLNLQHLLDGITFECPPKALAEKQVVVRCVLEGKNYTSIEIDRIFSASKAEGRSLYYVEDARLQSIEPDIIFTQDVCEVCQIDTECTARAVAKLEKKPQIIPISPESLQDVLDSVITIAKALGHEEAGYTFLADIMKRLDTITDKLREKRAPLKRVSLLEWLDPIYNCGHWIPHQLGYAGGIDMLSNPSGDSIVIQWEKIAKYDPEVIIIAPCGFDVNRTAEDLGILTNRKEWNSLQAVQNNAVYLADFDLFTQPSLGTIIEGIELLAALINPDIFEVPAHLAHKFAPMHKLQKVTS
ncbi:MAG: ABC transporter substrate-binding protein [Balneolaceae bacterium]